MTVNGEQHSDPEDYVTTVTSPHIRFILTVALFFVALYPVASLFYLQDIALYREGVIYILNGVNPYDLPHHDTVLSGSIGGVTLDQRGLEIWAPPYFVGALLPFALLPNDLWKALYLALLSALIVGSLETTYRALVGQYRSQALLLIATILLLPLFAFGEAVAWGGIGLPAAIGVFLLYTAGKNPLVAICALPLLFSKLQLSGLFLPCFLLHLWWNARPRIHVIVVWILELAVLAALTVFYASEYGARDMSTPVQFIVRSAGLGGLISSIVRPDSALVLACLTLQLGMLLYVLRYCMRSEDGRRSVLDVGVAFGPCFLFLNSYGWIHDYAVTALSATAVIRLFTDAPQRTVVVRSIISSTALTLVWLVFAADRGEGWVFGLIWSAPYWMALVMWIRNVRARSHREGTARATSPLESTTT